MRFRLKHATCHFALAAAMAPTLGCHTVPGPEAVSSRVASLEGEALAPTPTKRWWRGNTHTHTLWSDGDAAPEAAVDWYQTNGYDFLVLSDHNILAEGELWRPIGAGYKQARADHVDDLRARFGADSVQVRRTSDGVDELRLLTLSELRARFEQPGKFLLITGEEISDVFDGRPIHHNALNIGRTLEPTGGTSVRDLMRRTLVRIEEEGRRTGKPVLGHLNHPNYQWAVTAEDIAAVVEERFFEVYNGHRHVRNEGDADHHSTEATWDYVLTLRLGELAGPPLLALATDDSHHFHEFSATANPGRGWIVVRASELTANSIVAAMSAGDFYASSGVTLADIRFDGEKLTVEVAPDPGVSYTVRFVGTRRRPGVAAANLDIGEVLAEVTGTSATYQFQGDELYVRATVTSDRPHPNGYADGDLETAWVQPVLPGQG